MLQKQPFLYGKKVNYAELIQLCSSLIFRMGIYFRCIGFFSATLVCSLEITEKLECLLNSWHFLGADIPELGGRACGKHMRDGNRNSADSFCLST